MNPAVATLEDAVHLLRRAPPGVWLRHWVGSAPFALGLLLFWNDVSRYRVADSTCALDAVLLAVLLTWMNCWRAVFAGCLRRQLSGAPDSAWTARRTWRVVASQCFLGATKLVVMPLAGLIVFPLAEVAAFYRYTAALADRTDLDPRQLMATSAKLASFEKAQGWLLGLILLFLQLVIWANVALTLAILPQLIRILTGYESTFSRSGAQIISNPLFLLLTLVCAWLVFDPYLQAAYCVRCFRAESAETGEDLRAGLRRIAAALMVLALPLGAATPQQLEQSVHRAMQSHEYDWRLPPDAAAASQAPWLIAITDRVIAAGKSTFHAIGHALDAVIRWVFGKLGGLAEPTGGAAPAAALHWSVYLLIAVIAAVAGWLAWRMRHSRGPKPKAAPAAGTVAVSLEAEDLTADRLPEERWIDLAETLMREGNFRLALRAYYLANLAWLGRGQWIAIHPGKTNREYEFELRRKARAFAPARGLFSANIAAFERAWYGAHPVGAEDAEQFRARNGGMKAGLA